MRGPSLLISAFAPELSGLDLDPPEGWAIATVGIGAVHAAVETARLLREHRPVRVLFVGTCGAYDGRLAVGDLISASCAIATSVEEARGDAFRPAAEATRWPATWTLPFPAHDVAVPPAITATDDGARALARVAPAEHLELTGVLAACAAAGVPAGAVLGVANRVGPGAHAEWKRENARVSARVVEAIRPLLAAGPGAPVGPGPEVRSREEGTSFPQAGKTIDLDVVRVTAGRAARRADAVAVEEPLEIRVDGDTVAVTMRTPGADGDLALGFLLGEGMIDGAGDVGSASHCGRPGEEGYGNVIDVRSAGGHRIDPDRVLEGRRWSTTTSACGVCGRRSIEGLLSRCKPVGDRPVLEAAEVLRCVERLSGLQPVFSRTGGLHAAAAFGDGGTLLASAEDVGRHNAVDKVVGGLVRRGLCGRGAAPAIGLLAVSGRTSFEIVQKAAAAGIPVVAGVSAPSSLAVNVAREAGIALVGFARGDRLNVYTHAGRIATGPEG